MALASSQTIRQYKYETANYTSNGKSVIKLPKGPFLRDITLQYTGSITGVTGGSNTAANASRGNEWDLVTRIDIIANGNDIVRTFSGYELFLINKLMLGKTPRLAPSLGDGSSTTINWDTTIIVPVGLPMTRRPFDTVWDTSQFTDLRMEITWASGINPLVTTTGTLGSVQIETWCTTSYFQGNPPDNLTLFGSRINKIVKNYTASITSDRIDLPISSILAGFMINQSNAANVDSFVESTANVVTTGLQRLVIRSGPTVFLDMDYPALRERFLLRTNVQTETPTTAAGTYGNAVNRSSNAIMDANCMVWFPWDGMITEMIDATSLTELTAELDVAVPSGTLQLTILPVTLIKPARKAG